MTDTRMHNDCDGGECMACAWDDFIAKGVLCETCFWWLRDSLGDGTEGICRRYRPSRIETTSCFYSCGEHTFENPYAEPKSAQQPLC